MKKFLALAILATSTVSFAAERSIYDVMYQPTANTGYGFTTATWQQSSLKQSGLELKSQGYTLNQTVGYSFSDSFSLQGAFNYTNNRTMSDFSTNSNFEGLSDLTLSGRYRLMDSNFRFDIIGGALIGMGDREVSGNHINNKNGGNNYFIGAQLGQKHDSYQWSVLAQYTRHGETNTKVSGDVNNTTLDFNEAELRGDLLNRLTEKSFIRSFLGATMSDASTLTLMTYRIGAEYQHLCTENLLARAGVSYFVREGDLIDSNNGYQLTLGANYQF